MGRYGDSLVEKALRPLRFCATQMALTNLNSHNFAAAGNMEAALGSLMCFYFRHSEFLLPLPLS